MYMETAASMIHAADAFLWGPPLLILLLGTHLFFTIRLAFIQRHLGRALGIIVQQDKEISGNVSPFAALSVALASTIGTGNIVGVATAIVLGGPGAVFWCMLTGIFGMSTKYAESLLAVKYRIKDKDGEVHGGPMYTISRGLKQHGLAVVFCIFASIAALGTGSLVQSNAITAVIHRTFAVPGWLSGIILAVIVGLVILGGLRAIAKVCTYLVPFMSVVYLSGCFVLLIINYAVLWDSVCLIVRSAFSAKAAFGGVAGYGVMLAARYGIARGLFSNEAGMGSEPIVAATARTRNAVRQGLVSYTGTFCTIIICALTGILIVSCAVANPETIKLNNNEILTQVCFEQIPYVGKYLLSFAIFFFASTTIFGWFYYGEQCIRFLWNNPKVLAIYKVGYVLVTYIGAVSSIAVVWDFANFFNGLMVIPNIVSLLLLSPVVVAETRKYLWNNQLDSIAPGCKMN